MITFLYRQADGSAVPMITFTELEVVLLGAVVALLWILRTTRKESDMHKFAATHMMEAIKGIAEERYAVAKDKNGEFRLINLQEQAHVSN
jgi:uncharacterized membrane protein